jgi:DUF971 family protein
MRVDNAKSPAPKKVFQVDESTLGITWTDGLDARYNVRMLRQKCPCANCVDEWTGAPRLDPNSIPETVRPIKINNVGLYAIQFFWSDGHDSGLYSHEYLHKLANY